MSELKPYYVYIMTSARNGALYIGVTGDLSARVREHKTPRSAIAPNDIRTTIRRRNDGAGRGRDSCGVMDKLVYFERHDDIHGAIHQERRFNEWQRPWQKNLIEKSNPDWRDLFDDINCADGAGECNISIPLVDINTDNINAEKCQQVDDNCAGGDMCDANDVVGTVDIMECDVAGDIVDVVPMSDDFGDVSADDDASGVYDSKNANVMNESVVTN